jgi:hypothetical protein
MLALAHIFEHLDLISYGISWSNPPSQRQNKPLQNHPTTTSEHTSTGHMLGKSHVLSAFGHHIQIDILVILPSSSLQLHNFIFYVHVTVHRNKFRYNKTNQMHQFPKFSPAWNSTCFGRFLCPSSGVYSLYTQQWYMSHRFVDSFQAAAYAPARKLSTNL